MTTPIFLDGREPRARPGASIGRALAGASLIGLLVALSACGATGASGAHGMPADILDPLDAALDTACDTVNEQTAVAEVLWDGLGSKDQDAVLAALGYAAIFCQPGYTPSGLGVALMTAQAATLAEVLHDKILP